MFQKIILASQSPRRKQLLEWAELNFEVMVSDTDESFPPELSFPDAAMHIAFEKAKAVKSGAGSLPIVAADTIVVCDDKLLGKPTDREDAIRMIKLLSGRVHVVITGVCILHGEEINCFYDETRVWFNELSDEEIGFYVDRHKPFDKAGAYAIQEWIGVVGIKKIEGDFYNVMGLPVNRVYRELEKMETITDYRL
jgi:septum formation protein